MSIVTYKHFFSRGEGLRQISFSTWHQRHSVLCTERPFLLEKKAKEGEGTILSKNPVCMEMYWGKSGLWLVYFYLFLCFFWGGARVLGWHGSLFVIKLVLSSKFSCLSLLRSKITCVYHHTRLVQFALRHKTGCGLRLLHLYQ